MLKTVVLKCLGLSLFINSLSFPLYADSTAEVNYADPTSYINFDDSTMSGRCSTAINDNTPGRTSTGNSTSEVIQLGLRKDPSLEAALKKITPFEEVVYRVYQVKVNGRLRNILQVVENPQISFEARLTLAKTIEDFRIKLYWAPLLKGLIEQEESFGGQVVSSLDFEHSTSPVFDFKGRDIEPPQEFINSKIMTELAQKIFHVHRPMTHIAIFSRVLLYDFKEFKSTGVKSEFLQSVYKMLETLSATDLVKYNQILIQIKNQIDQTPESQFLEAATFTVEGTIDRIAHLFPMTSEAEEDKWINARKAPEASVIKRSWKKFLAWSSRKQQHIRIGSILLLGVPIVLSQTTSLVNDLGSFAAWISLPVITGLSSFILPFNYEELRRKEANSGNNYMVEHIIAQFKADPNLASLLVVTSGSDDITLNQTLQNSFTFIESSNP